MMEALKESKNNMRILRTFKSNNAHMNKIIMDFIDSGRKS